MNIHHCKYPSQQTLSSIHYARTCTINYKHSVLLCYLVCCCYLELLLHYTHTTSHRDTSIRFRVAFLLLLSVFGQEKQSSITTCYAAPKHKQLDSCTNINVSNTATQTIDSYFQTRRTENGVRKASDYSYQALQIYTNNFTISQWPLPATNWTADKFRL